MKKFVVFLGLIVLAMALRVTHKQDDEYWGSNDWNNDTSGRDYNGGYYNGSNDWNNNDGGNSGSNDWNNDTSGSGSNYWNSANDNNNDGNN